MYPKKCKEKECRGIGNGKGNTMKKPLPHLKDKGGV